MVAQNKISPRRINLNGILRIAVPSSCEIVQYIQSQRETAQIWLVSVFEPHDWLSWRGGDTRRVRQICVERPGLSLIGILMPWVLEKQRSLPLEHQPVRGHGGNGAGESERHHVSEMYDMYIANS